MQHHVVIHKSVPRQAYIRASFDEGFGSRMSQATSSGRGDRHPRLSDIRQRLAHSAADSQCPCNCLKAQSMITLGTGTSGGDIPPLTITPGSLKRIMAAVSSALSGR